MQRWVPLVLATALSAIASPVRADVKAERTAVIAIDLGNGIPEFVRAKAVTRSQEGLTAAGLEVVPLDQTKAKLAANLATCRDGGCLKQVGEALSVPLLLTGAITRKDESTIIVFKLFEASSGEVLAEIHEVCDLCGQDELEERIGVAASALRVKAEAAKAKRAAAPQSVPVVMPSNGKIVVGIVPSLVVNLDAARADSLAQVLKEAIEAELVVEAKGGLEVRRALGADVAADCATTPACSQDVARKLGANQLLFVVMVATGNQLQLDSTWVDASTGQTQTRPPVDVANLNDPKARFQAAAPQLLPGAMVRPKAGDTKGPNLVTGGEVPMHFTTAAKVTGAIGVVGLATGAVLGILTRSKYGTCEDDPASCSQSNKDAIRNFGLAADAGFAIGIAGVIATTILYATSGEKAHLVVAPAATPEGGGGVSIGAVGRF